MASRPSRRNDPADRVSRLFSPRLKTTEVAAMKWFLRIVCRMALSLPGQTQTVGHVPGGSQTVRGALHRPRARQVGDEGREQWRATDDYRFGGYRR